MSEGDDLVDEEEYFSTHNPNKYKKWIQYLTSNEFLDEFFENRKEEIKKINSLIYDDYFFTDHNYFYGPGIYYFSKEDIYIRAKTLKDYFLETPDKVFIEQFNTNLKITNLSYNNLSLQVDEIQCRNQKNNLVSFYLFDVLHILYSKPYFFFFLPHHMLAVWRGVLE